MQKFRFLLAAAAVVSLSACLDSDLERGVAGAAAGAVVAEVVGVDPITGALVGGAAGALCDEVVQVCN